MDFVGDSQHFVFTPVNFEEPFCFEVSNDDTVVENEEYFDSVLSGDGGVVVKNQLRIRIIDDDGENSQTMWLI